MFHDRHHSQISHCICTLTDSSFLSFPFFLSFPSSLSFPFLPSFHSFLSFPSSSRHQHFSPGEKEPFPQRDWSPPHCPRQKQWLQWQEHPRRSGAVCSSSSSCFNSYFDGETSS